MIGVAAVAGLLVISASVYMVANQSANKSAEKSKASATPPASVSPTAAATASPVVPAAGASSYRNGTYFSLGNYRAPSGDEQVGVTVTLKDGIITATTAEAKSQNATARQFQNTFASNYQPLVVGRPIKNLMLDRVSGSSLTPNGFNDALEKIKAQARA